MLHYKAKHNSSHGYAGPEEANPRAGQRGRYAALFGQQTAKPLAGAGLRAGEGREQQNAKLCDRQLVGSDEVKVSIWLSLILPMMLWLNMHRTHRNKFIAMGSAKMF